MMAASRASFVILLATTLTASGQSPAAKPTDEQAIRAVTTAFVEAFAKGDAPAIAALFTEQGEAIDTDGAAIQGRKELEDHYTARFAAMPGAKIETTIDLVQMIAPEVARQDGKTRLMQGPDVLPSQARFTSTFVKIQGKWLIASVRELDDPSITHHERLRELEWMVGEWLEETSDTRVMTKIAWADDENFLLRTYEIHVDGKPDAKGSQRIGWDPMAKQFRSWVFDSKGGFSEGHWTYDNDRWVIKSSGVRPDGAATTATQFLRQVSRDRMSWQSTDRTVGGEIQDDTPEYLMVKKPPEPK